MKVHKQQAVQIAQGFLREHECNPGRLRKTLQKGVKKGAVAHIATFCPEMGAQYANVRL